MALKEFFNVKDSEFALLIAWLTQASKPTGPFPPLGFTGPFGTGKTTAGKILRRVIDPNSMALQKLPRDEQDLLVAALGKSVLVFDNISAINPDIFDSLCQLCTGGGLEKRRLYTNREKAILEAMRPAVLNGIGDIFNRPDFASRLILLNLLPIVGPHRDEDDIIATFDAMHAAILGALLDGLSHGLLVRPASTHVPIGRLPDFERWAVACLGAYPELAGKFSDAYALNKDDAIDMLIENDMIAVSIVTMLNSRASWEGTSSDLLDTLKLVVSDAYKGNRRWPTSPEQMGKALASVVTLLERRGIKYTSIRTGKHRMHRLVKYREG